MHVHFTINTHVTCYTAQLYVLKNELQYIYRVKKQKNIFTPLYKISLSGDLSLYYPFQPRLCDTV